MRFDGLVSKGQQNILTKSYIFSLLRTELSYKAKVFLSKIIYSVFSKIEEFLQILLSWLGWTLYLQNILMA